MTTLREQLASRELLQANWLELLGRDLADRTLGSDVREFMNDLGVRLGEMASAVRQGTYRVGDLRRLTFSENDDERVLHLPPVADRVLEGALADVIDSYVDPLLSPDSFAYRRGLGVTSALGRVADLRQSAGWVLRADLTDCFDHIDRAESLRILRARLPDKSLDWLLAQLDERAATALRSADRGVPQGAPTSPLLANLALDRLDRALWECGLAHVRYADDLLVVCASEVATRDALVVLRALVRQEGHEVNESKVEIMSFREGFTFLGVPFVGGLPVVADEVATGLARPLYVSGDHVVSSRRGRVLVHRDGKPDPVLSLPQTHVARIVTFGAVGLSNGVRQWALSSAVPVSLMSTYGRHLGDLVAPATLGCLNVAGSIC